MKTFIAAAGLAVGASAAVLPRGDDQCCFQLTASGGQSGTLGQLGDGQNRIGGGYSPATYCLSGGSITDKSGRGCILTSPTTQFQCDTGATPTSGFSIGSGGNVMYEGGSTFYACPADKGEYNIYTQPVKGQSKCVKITLSTGGQCANNGYQSQTMQTYPATTMTSTCPAASTEYKTEYQTKYSTQYSTKTEYQTKYDTKYATEYETKYETEMTTCPAPSTSTEYKYKTEYQTAPAQTVTAYKTKYETEMTTCPAPSTEYKTEYQTKYETEMTTCPTMPASTEYKYQTKYETATAPAQTVTAYKTKYETEMTTCPAPSTEYKTEYQTKYETEMTTCPTMPASTEYKYQTKYETATAPAQTVTAYKTKYEKEMTSCPAPSTEYKTEYQTQECQTQTEYQTEYQTMPTMYTSTKQYKPTTTAKSSACQTSLVPGAYQTPHLIVPMSSEHPDEAYGTSYNCHMNSTMNTIMNFDIPQSYEGKTCTVMFMFPEKKDLETTDWTYNGKGSMEMSMMSSPASQDTTWNNCPKASEAMDTIQPQPGNTYVMHSGPCAAGTTQAMMMSAKGGMEMEFFEDWNPSPLGVFMSVCE